MLGNWFVDFFIGEEFCNVRRTIGIIYALCGLFVLGVGYTIIHFIIKYW